MAVWDEALPSQETIIAVSASAFFSEKDASFACNNSTGDAY
jgi:hypothetical protein